MFKIEGKIDPVIVIEAYLFILFYLFIHYLQLGRHPVAGVVTCYISTDYEDFTLNFRYGGLHEKHVVKECNNGSTSF